MEIYTIGFTQTTAAEFFGKLKQAGIRRLVDVRLNNVSQLAGFAKRDDLKYFLAEICGIQYVHEPRLAPTPDILDAYKKEKGSWEELRTPVPAIAARPADRDGHPSAACSMCPRCCSAASPRPSTATGGWWWSTWTAPGVMSGRFICENPGGGLGCIAPAGGDTYREACHQPPDPDAEGFHLCGRRRLGDRSARAADAALADAQGSVGPV